MIELANRNCLILSDSDKVAKEQKKEYKRMRGFGDWKTYQDINQSIEAITGEDFIKNDFIAEQVNAVLSDDDLIFDKAILPEKKRKLSTISK